MTNALYADLPSVHCQLKAKLAEEKDSELASMKMTLDRDVDVAVKTAEEEWLKQQEGETNRRLEEEVGHEGGRGKGWGRVGWHIDGLVQERRNSIANALELRLSCTNPSMHRNFHNKITCITSSII